MIKALQKALKVSQYMQNILCFGVFARDDASGNYCDSRLNINCHLKKINVMAVASVKRAELAICELVETLKIANSQSKDCSAMTGNDWRDNKGLAGRRLLWWLA